MDGAAALLGGHLSVSRVGYGEFDVTANRVTIGHEYRDTTRSQPPSAR